MGACRTDLKLSVSPAAAVPVRMNMPEPITAPMPNAVRLHGPRVRRSFRSDGSMQNRFEAQRLAGGGRPREDEYAGTDHRADAERRQAPRTQGAPKLPI